MSNNTILPVGFTEMLIKKLKKACNFQPVRKIFVKYPVSQLTWLGINSLERFC